MDDTTVTAVKRFTERIGQLRRRIFFKQSCCIVLYASTLFLLQHGLVLAFEKSGVYRVERDGLLYFSLVAVALLTAGIIFYIRKISLFHLLIDIDDRFGLQDRLSTAYEYQQRRKNSIFSEDLLEDAVHSLNGFRMKELLPLNFSRLYLGLLILGLCNGLLLYVESPPRENASALNSQMVKLDSSREAELTLERQAQRNGRLREKEKSVGLQRMREKHDEFRRKPLSREERAMKLREMLQEVQGMRKDLADSGTFGEADAELENLPFQQVSQQPGMMVKLDALEDLLERMLSRQEADASNSSQELSAELQEQFSELLKDLERELPPPSQEAHRRSAGQDVEGAESSADEESSDESSGKQAGRNRERQAENAGDGNNERGDQERQDGRMPVAGREGDMERQRWGEGNEFRASAGNDEPDGEEFPPSEPETTDRPVQQDRIQASKQDQYNVYIRSVTEIGKARLPEQDLTRPYRREVESVLQQEEMPLNYREYIKNYFLSIGLTEGE